MAFVQVQHCYSLLNLPHFEDVRAVCRPEAPKIKEESREKNSSLALDLPSGSRIHVSGSVHALVLKNGSTTAT